MGFEAVLMAPSTNDSVEEQVKIMEDLIQKGVDGFVLVPVDTNGIMPGVRKAMEKKKYFTPFPSEKDKPLITAENVDYYMANIAWRRN